MTVTPVRSHPVTAEPVLVSAPIATQLFAGNVKSPVVARGHDAVREHDVVDLPAPRLEGLAPAETTPVAPTSTAIEPIRVEATPATQTHAGQATRFPTQVVTPIATTPFAVTNPISSQATPVNQAPVASILNPLLTTPISLTPSTQVDSTTPNTLTVPLPLAPIGPPTGLSELSSSLVSQFSITGGVAPDTSMEIAWLRRPNAAGEMVYVPVPYNAQAMVLGMGLGMGMGMGMGGIGGAGAIAGLGGAGTMGELGGTGMQMPGGQPFPYVGGVNGMPMGAMPMRGMQMGSMPIGGMPLGTTPLNGMAGSGMTTSGPISGMPIGGMQIGVPGSGMPLGGMPGAAHGSYGIQGIPHPSQMQMHVAPQYGQAGTGGWHFSGVPAPAQPAVLPDPNGLRGVGNAGNATSG
ncbi:hypothetical protein HDU93_009024 [Gonapodya sp. JEL0774]|nr:hypothetical protein HDU93_009024 [Gonapodya sp. JEL0774]